MKLDWEQLHEVLRTKQATVIAELLQPQDHDKTQYSRGFFAALKWVAEIPQREEEDAEYERQRERDAARNY